jgi:exopolysaccharide production protein ExoQ
VIPQIATLACLTIIAVLFRLDRDRAARTSWALWLPVIWLAIAGSRNLSVWMQFSGPSDYADQYMEGSPIDRNVLALLLGLGLVTLARRRRRVHRLLALNLPVIAYFAYCFVSIIWSDFPLIAFKRWFRAIGDLTMVLVVLTDANGIAAVKRVFTRIAFVFFPVSILFIRYYPDLGRAYGQDGSLYWTGVASGKNGLGMICLIFGLAMIWRWLVEYRADRGASRRRRLAALSVVIVMALWLLWIADSKTSLACLVLVTGLVAVTILVPFGQKPAVLHTMVWTVVAVCFSVLFLGIGSSALTTLGRDASLTGRTDVWNLVLRFAENPMMGAGYESFWLGPRLEQIIRINGGINQAHNGYIEVYLNLGFAGLAILGTIILTGYRKIVAGFRKDPQISMLRIAYFVIAIVYNFTEGAFKMMAPVWIAFLLATMAVPRRRTAASRQRIDAYSNRGRAEALQIRSVTC